MTDPFWLTDAVYFPSLWIGASYRISSSSQDQFSFLGLRLRHFKSSVRPRSFLDRHSLYLSLSFIWPRSRSASPRYVVWICRDSNMIIIALRHLCIISTLLDRFSPSPTDLHGSRRLEFRSSRCASSSCWCCNVFLVRFDLSLPRFRRKALPVRPPRDSWLHVHPLFPLIIYSCSLFVPLLGPLSCSHVIVLILYCSFFFLFSFFFFSSNRALFGLPS